ncbi:hypothetical protein GGI23_002899 [Coemansia sp. RSA 2559]|nr:hypothetical protein GGI23_002899 [Coemansia sp. RSA 2559]
MLCSPQSARAQHPALLSSSPLPPEKATEAEASARVTHGEGLDLGLDLGLSVSRRTAATSHRGPQLFPGMPGPASLDLDIAAAGTSTGTQTEDDVMASILEITSFLERDVDVFTPLSATTRTASMPRSSAFADPLSSSASSKPKIDTSKCTTTTTTSTPPGDC